MVRRAGLTPQLTAKPLAEAADWINHIQSVSKYPLLLGWCSINFSGATEVRLMQSMRIGATRSKELAYLAGKIEAVEGRAVGFHVTGFPNLDVNTNPDNPIINLRSYSDDPDLVSDLGLETARGILDGRAIANACHFPGHGATAEDSHVEIGVVNHDRDRLREIDLKPFQAAFDARLLNFICTNHCHHPAYEADKAPGTVSRQLIHDLARSEMGYDGVIMSDSLTMRAMKHNYGIEQSAILAVRAGHDVILQDYESDPQITLDALVKAVKDGQISIEQIDGSVRRVMAVKQWLGLFDDRLVDAHRIPQLVATEEHRAVAQRIARQSVTVLENRDMPLSRGRATKTGSSAEFVGGSPGSSVISVGS